MTASIRNTILGGAVALAMVVASNMSPARAQATFDWSGFYFGLGAGGAWSGAEYDNFVVGAGGTDGGLTAGGIDHEIEGLIFGAHAGLQHQMGNFVFGIEATVANISDEDVSFGTFDDVYTTELNSLVTATARVGYVLGDWLAYAKGGYASGEVTAQIFDPTPGDVKDTDIRRHHGFTFGGGFEYRLNQFIILGAEYSYIDLESKNYNWVSPTGGVTSFRVTPDDIHTMMGRISFIFGVP